MRRFDPGVATVVSREFVKRVTSIQVSSSLCVLISLCLALFLETIAPLHGREHARKKESYGLGFSIEIASSEDVVLQALNEVLNDGLIQGSKEYNKDKYIEKADPAESSPLFPGWKEGGKVFYKVRTKVLSPTNFYESNDEGTLAVRYVVQVKDPAKTVLRIDAVFVEDFRRVAHPSDGSVETGEYKDIQDHIDAIELQKKQAKESEQHRQEVLAKQALERKNEEQESEALAAAETSEQNLEQYVQQLRRKAERVIRAPGGELRSAPFHSASNLRTLEAGTEVVILIATPYWYGVETEDGQHGWVGHEQLEPLP